MKKALQILALIAELIMLLDKDQDGQIDFLQSRKKDIEDNGKSK